MLSPRSTDRADEVFLRKVSTLRGGESGSGMRLLADGGSARYEVSLSDHRLTAGLAEVIKVIVDQERGLEGFFGFTFSLKFSFLHKRGLLEFLKGQDPDLLLPSGIQFLLRDSEKKTIQKALKEHYGNVPAYSDLTEGIRSGALTAIVREELFWVFYEAGLLMEHQSFRMNTVSYGRVC